MHTSLFSGTRSSLVTVIGLPLRKQFLKKLLKAGTRWNISRPESSLAYHRGRRLSAQHITPQWQGPFGLYLRGSPSGHLLWSLQPWKCCHSWCRGSCSFWKAGQPAKWMMGRWAGREPASFWQKSDKLGFHRISYLKHRYASFHSYQSIK